MVDRGGGLPLTAFGQNAPRIAPVPRDPLELATGQIQVAAHPRVERRLFSFLPVRETVLLCEAPAKPTISRSVLRWTRSARRTMTAPGKWKICSPRDKDSAGRLSRIRIHHNRDLREPARSTREGTASAVPLRLQEARGVLFDPIQSPAYADRGSIRTSTATFHGATVTCVLLSRSRNAANPALGRDWEETEECIDPQSGLAPDALGGARALCRLRLLERPSTRRSRSASKRDRNGSGQNRVEDFG